MIKALIVLVLLFGAAYVLFSQATITGMSVFDQSPVLDKPSVVFPQDDLVTCCQIDDPNGTPRFCYVRQGVDCAVCDPYCESD